MGWIPIYCVLFLAFLIVLVCIGSVSFFPSFSDYRPSVKTALKTLESLRLLLLSKPAIQIWSRACDCIEDIHEYIQDAVEPPLHISAAYSLFSVFVSVFLFLLQLHLT